ncbi:hypothetical protein CcI49_03170 [Frankia sp. CcI49]|uniref:hypothetical protein n=1 Tax=Frankia sp. CcI49 TaxID=1745382 RepID=UPI00097744C3|nr:hypothetical protein [Frankia sp. CcI49]ONH62394.1 hypothetical protein CcI49_03170 [Frankia sp. CcI49]
MTPDWRSTATRVGLGALAPFVSPVLPEGNDSEVREQISSIARDGDNRLLPVVAGAAALGALRTRRDQLALEAGPERLALEAGPTPLELESSDGWTPDMDPDLGWA